MEKRKKMIRQKEGERKRKRHKHKMSNILILNIQKRRWNIKHKRRRRKRKRKRESTLARLSRQRVERRRRQHACPAGAISNCSDRDWCTDSAATSSMTGSLLIRRRFRSGRKCHVEVIVANNGVLIANYIGDLSLITEVGDRKYQLLLRDVLFVPGLAMNLLSVPKLTASGHQVLITASKLEIIRYLPPKCTLDNVYTPLSGLSGNSRNGGNRENTVSGTVIAIAHARDNLYFLSTLTEVTEAANSATTASSTKKLLYLTHLQYNHRNYDDVLRILNLPLTTECDPCDTCRLGKSTRKTVPKSTTTTSPRLGYLIHSDIVGSFSVRTPSGKLYFLSFIDDRSRRGTAWSYLLRAKSEFDKCYKELEKQLNNVHGITIAILRTDGAGECFLNTFTLYLESRGTITKSQHLIAKTKME